MSQKQTGSGDNASRGKTTDTLFNQSHSPISIPIFLFAFANDEQGSLRLGKEQNAIWNELAHLDQTGVIDCQRMGFATLEQIYREFNRFNDQIYLFHYGGHSNSEVIHLQDADGSAKNLGLKIGLQKNLKLVFLNGCKNYQQVEALLELGIPAVIATTADVDDERAIMLAQQFYQALAGGSSIQNAFDSAKAFLFDKHPSLKSTYRNLGFARKEQENKEFSWGLYSANSPSLDWKIPKARFTESTQAEKSSQKIVELLEPRIPRHFRDREMELAALLKSVKAKRLCGLFGMGGTGKTILAAQVAKQARKSDKTKVIWLSNKGEISIDQILETLAQSLGHSLRTIQDTNQRNAYLRGVTEDQDLLVVLDDVNQDSILDNLLDSIGEGNAVLVTGRDLGLQSIRKFGLTVTALQPLPPKYATEVLLELAGQGNTEPQDLSPWVRLAQSAGNLPLALEIIAGDLFFRTDPDPTTYLENEFRTGKWLSNEKGENPLQNILQNSVEQLPANYRKAFACLGVFSGGKFDPNAVRSVCGFNSLEETEDFLIAIRKRMLIRDELEGWLSLHPVIRQFAQHQLERLELEPHEADSPIRKYTSFYSGLLYKYGGYEWNIGKYSNLIAYESEIIHAINSAYDLWINNEVKYQENFGIDTIKMTFYISWYLLWRGFWDLRIQLCRQITDKLDKSGLLQSPLSRYSNMAGNLYVDQGWIHIRRENFDKTEYCVARAKPLLNRIDKDFAIELEAQLALKTNKAERAHELFNILRNDETKNSRQWFVFSYRFSDSLVKLGKRQEAIQLLRNLLAKISDVKIFRDEIITDVHACIAYRLAILLKEDNDIQAAEILLEKSVQLFKDSGITDQTTVSAQIALAEILLALNQHKEAKELLNEAMGQAQRIGERTLSTRIEKML